MKAISALAFVAIILTAALSIVIVGDGREPVPEPTTASQTVETTEQAQAPAETTEPTTQATEPPTQAPETTAPTEAPTEPTYYDVPLDHGLQDHIRSLCDGYGIEPAVVVAMIWKESQYNQWAVGDNGNSLGLMQIQPKWNQWRMDALGCPDLLDPYQNVTVGINILYSHLELWGDIEMALISYNCGATGANNNYFSKGIYSSKYSRAVLEKAAELKGD